MRGRASAAQCTLAALVVTVGIGSPAPAVGAQEALVESIDVANNQFLQKETLLFYVSTKPGDRYDERRLRDDFRRLWDTGFLDNLSVESHDGARGKIVVFHVSERKRIQIVDYRGSKALTTTNIEDELKKREMTLKVDTFYDPSKARRVEDLIREMLDEKGHPFAKVKHDAKPIGGAGLQVSFVVDDGPRAKVQEITFDGNSAFSDAKLRAQMKKIKAAGLWNLSWLGGKTTYTADKWRGGEADPRGDQGRLEDFYLNNGYVQARVGEPRISYSDPPRRPAKASGSAAEKKRGRRTKLVIPVTEGPQFRVGEVKFEGLTVFKEESIRPLFKLDSGDVYNESRLKKGFDKLRDLYGAVGYFQWTGGPKKKPDLERKVVDVVLGMDEDKRYYVGRITFTGNESTRDKVIRREVFMNEGDVFNTEALKQSIRRINQLGYFKPMEGAPQLQPNHKHDDQIDITFKVQEQNRNQFAFGGGVSGIEGRFVNASFSTANFLGLGETVSIAAQAGQRTRNYQLAVSEPYFLDRPITAGLDVFLRRTTYYSSQNFVGFSEQDQGISATTGFAAGRFTRLFGTYGYQIVDIYGVDQTQLAALKLSEASYLQKGRRYESRFTPAWVRSTVDSPFTPRRGTKQTASFEFVGGPLGGSVSYYSPSVESIFYHPVTRKTAFGVRVQGAFVIPFSTTQEVPYYKRFFLGGENQIRGFNIRSISPVDAQKAATGGHKFVLFNAEYYFDLFGPLRFLLFYDAGEAYLRGQNIDLRTLSTSTGAEVRFLMPVLNVPFRLIYAWNPNRASSQPATAFKFAVGTTF